MADLGDDDVGARIRALRKERGWSAQKLADECEQAGIGSLNRSALAKVEAGQRRLQTNEAVILAQVLDVTLNDLLKPGTAQAGDPADRADPAGAEPLDGSHGVRRSEAGVLLSDLDSVRGSHQWLIVGPPGAGKSTLLAQLSRAAAADVPGWETRLVDVSQQDRSVRENACELLGVIFDVEPRAADDPDTHRVIAQRLSRAGKRFLCLLDGAEQLSERISAELRSALRGVYRYVPETGNPDVRLAFVVASRQDAGWRGVWPDPRLEVLSLTGFSRDVVEDMLRDWAGPARAARYSDEQFSRWAALVHRLTAGWPPLLEPFLNWIRAEEWLVLERLESPAVFESLTGDYIRDSLLAPDAIMPRGKAALTQARYRVLEMAIRLLVRYRFFTHSHVRYHLGQDAEFRRDLKDAGWEVEDLWAALSGMTLLAMPLAEPWKAFHPAIRALLSRHFYRADAERAAAHLEARDFIDVWAAKQTGMDLAIGLVESFWHYAAALCLEQPPGALDKLADGARHLGGALAESGSYTAQELRAYAAERIRNDAELRDAISQVGGQPDRLIDLITAQA